MNSENPLAKAGRYLVQHPAVLAAVIIAVAAVTVALMFKPPRYKYMTGVTILDTKTGYVYIGGVPKPPKK